MSNIKNNKDIYDFWVKENLFSAEPKSKKKPYSLLVPPPNLTGELHLGHAMQHSIMDAIGRYKRLQGYDVLLLPGVDHAGIQFESTFDRYLKKKGLWKKKMGRDKWLEEAWKYKKEIYTSVSKTWRFMGLGADWDKEVFTLDEGPRKAVFHEFKTFYEKGMIYKGPYIVNWCPKDNTAIEDIEIEYEERKEKLYYLKYGPFTLATARPETKFGDTAMAVHPDDKRYKKNIGKKFTIQTLTGIRKMILVGDKAVDPKFGTGVIKVTPGHSFDDYEIGKRHDLPIVQVIDKEGRLTEKAGRYEGMKVMEAREKMLPELKEKGILIKTEDYTHNVPVCERCKSIVEPLISEEWFVKADKLAEGAISAINKDEVTFLPKNYKKILIVWLNSIHDWCISRTLWWGHRIPVWYKGKQQKISLESPGKGWKQDEQVLDTWFSSGLWPMSTLGWPKQTPELAKYFPWDIEVTAPEIKFLWIARMIMLSKYFKNNVPFRTMFFHGMLRDIDGRKFSKSLGNGVDPNYLIDKWGVDATRMTLYTYSIPGRDGRVSKNTLDERAKNFRNFVTKLRNVSRFILELKPKKHERTLKLSTKDDKWIMDELDKTIKKVTKNLDNLELHLAVDELYNFVWHSLADKYIENSKNRREETQPILEYVLKHTLIMLHPFMPFTTEELYWKFKVRKKSILLEDFPQ